MLRLNSSLRSVEPEHTIELAQAIAARFGITRVTDITRLDKIGIPVFASIRPSATLGSLCVNNGKGVRPIDACVGAYMEAIEYAIAEPGYSHVQCVESTLRDVLDGRRRPNAFVDLCPLAQKGLQVSAPLECVWADELVEGLPMLVPAELVFVPYKPSTGRSLFGSSSNGLASGNTVDEATLHALFELIERDINSFNIARDTALRVEERTLPGVATEQLNCVRAAGFELLVRFMPNPFEIPMFEAYVWDPSALGPLVVAGGYGCHLLPEIALVRAITEAVQSRLTTIHGGRDDLEEQVGGLLKRGMAAHEEAASTRFLTRSMSAHSVDYADISGPASSPTSISDALGLTFERLLRQGIRYICRVVLTSDSDPLQVVRIIVPKLEFLDHTLHRIGPRLYDYLYRSQLS